MKNLAIAQSGEITFSDASGLDFRVSPGQKGYPELRAQLPGALPAVAPAATVNLDAAAQVKEAVRQENLRCARVRQVCESLRAKHGFDVEVDDTTPGTFEPIGIAAILGGWTPEQTERNFLAAIGRTSAADRSRADELYRIYGSYRTAYRCEFETDDASPGKFETLEAQAIAGGWSPETLQEKILDVIRAQNLRPVA